MLCAFYLAGLHALGANVCTLYGAVLLDGNLLNVGTEGAVAYAMRVADTTTSDGCLTADLANFRHSQSTPFTSYWIRQYLPLFTKALVL